jgi:hypothetical protein
VDKPAVFFFKTASTWEPEKDATLSPFGILSRAPSKPHTLATPKPGKQAPRHTPHLLVERVVVAAQQAPDIGQGLLFPTATEVGVAQRRVVILTRRPHNRGDRPRLKQAAGDDALILKLPSSNNCRQPNK